MIALIVADNNAADARLWVPQHVKPMGGTPTIFESEKSRLRRRFRGESEEFPICKGRARVRRSEYSKRIRGGEAHLNLAGGHLSNIQSTKGRIGSGEIDFNCADVRVCADDARQTTLVEREGCCTGGVVSG